LQIPDSRRQKRTGEVLEPYRVLGWRRSGVNLPEICPLYIGWFVSELVEGPRENLMGAVHREGDKA
jgi:hypothetical protein